MDLVYVVKTGRIPGIYNTYQEMIPQVIGYKGAQFKKCTRKEALEWLTEKLIHDSDIIIPNKEPYEIDIQIIKNHPVHKEGWIQVQIKYRKEIIYKTEFVNPTNQMLKKSDLQWIGLMHCLDQFDYKTNEWHVKDASFQLKKKIAQFKYSSYR